MDIVKLRELLEQELSSVELTELDDDFYQEFDSLIKALKLSAESSRERGENVEEKLYLAQLRIAEELIKEIIKLRLHKIVDLAVEGKPAEMTSEERKIFRVLRAFLEREEIPEVESLEVETTETEGTETEEPARSLGNVYIVTENLPVILGSDMREYGPFKAWDMVVLPEEIGRVLVEREVAFRVKFSP
ncbi:DNA replication complex subunit Gins51 [Thermococcus sp.]